MPVEILMPTLSPTMEEGTLAKWLVKEGDSIASGDVIAEIETDKATMDFEVADDGTMGALLVAEGTTGVKVNTPIAVLLGAHERTCSASAGGVPSPSVPPFSAPRSATGPSESTAGARVHASPLARRVAAERGVDLSQISGSGPQGRIILADVSPATDLRMRSVTGERDVSAAPEPLGRTGTTSTQSEDVAEHHTGGIPNEIPLNGMRRMIAARVTEATQTIPHFHLRRDIRIDALLALRSEINLQLASRGIRLSVNDFVIKACALALQRTPEANVVWDGDRLRQFTASDIAVAVAVEGGLFTPVLRDAEAKSLSVLSAEMKDLVSRARNHTLAPHDYQGGSFTISNLGMFGVENFDAVINPPQAAILAVGAGIRKPVLFENDDIGAATVMSVTLSVDHRVMDGALGARLLASIVQDLEHPVAMLA